MEKDGRSPYQVVLKTDGEAGSLVLATATRAAGPQRAWFGVGPMTSRKAGIGLFPANPDHADSCRPNTGLEAWG